MGPAFRREPKKDSGSGSLLPKKYNFEMQGNLKTHGGRRGCKKTPTSESRRRGRRTRIGGATMSGLREKKK